MTRTTRANIWTACCLAILPCLPGAATQVAAQQSPPPPGADAAATGRADESGGSRTLRAFVENSSPATFGAAVVIAADGHLVVEDVVQGSQAAKAGLAVGDEIISVNGSLITQPEVFNSYLATHPADTMQFMVVRDGVQRTLVVNPANADPQGTAPEATERRPALGMRFLKGNDVILRAVLPGSPAHQAGLQQGDRVTAVEGTPLTSTNHFIASVAASPLDSPMNVVVLRNGEYLNVTLTPAAWDEVFGDGNGHTTLKPGVPGYRTPRPFITYAGQHAYATAVSPVGLPAIAFPTRFSGIYNCTGRRLSCDYMGYGWCGFHPNWYVHAWPMAPVQWSGP